MKNHEGMTRKQLSKITGAPPYTIAYLNSCGRLPMIKESNGKGSIAIYHPGSVRIIEKHLNLHSEESSNETS